MPNWILDILSGLRVDAEVVYDSKGNMHVLFM